MPRRGHRQRWRLVEPPENGGCCDLPGIVCSRLRTFFFMTPQSIRKRVIQEWRGLPQPEEKADRMLSIREVLVQLAPALGLETRLREEEIFSAWSEIVGEFFARHSRPVRLHQGLLVVNVLQPTVLYELDRQWKPLILSKLKKRFGGRLIKELRFRIG
jgi:predicted nucleic acid-binding Zn ribbon protein